MKQVLILGVVLLFCSVAFGQISKRQWLIGGSGSIYWNKTTSPNYYTSKNSGLTLSPGAGYFPVNNLAVGIRSVLGYGHSKSSFESGTGGGSKQSSWGAQVGPFVRYYFLPSPNKLNVLAEANYYAGWSHLSYDAEKNAYHSHGYGFSAGPVWFITPATGLEVTLNYNNDNQPAVRSSKVALNVGLQVHLGKGKK